MNNGTKYDADKPMINLMPARAELEVAKVLTFGAENWRLVENADDRYMAAAMRHINAARRGEVLDDESGLNHLAHAVCCLMFILELAQE